MKNEIYYFIETPAYTRTVVRLPDTKAMQSAGWEGRFKQVVVEPFGDIVVTKTTFYYGCVNEDRSQAFQEKYVYLTKWSEAKNN